MDFKLSFENDRELIFHRTALAENLLRSLVTPVYKSGLFLSAPRRTGKTTFIKADLLPMLRQAGAIVIYADLWEQRSTDPAKVVNTAIADAILEEAGPVAKAARAVGLQKVKVAGFEIDLEAIGKHDGDTIAKTLEKLSAAANKPIVMVIDEAQHAQASEAGRDTLFALKAARDAMILGEGKGFRLIATGSNSDRLRMLVASKDQAFFGAMEEHLPELDDAYLQWVLDNSTFKGQLSLNVLRQGFEVLGHRPEPLQGLLLELQREVGFNTVSIDAVFVERAKRSMDHQRQMFLSMLRSMEPLNAAVFRRMSELGNNFTPFDEAALKHYQALMANDDPSVGSERPTKSQVQGALERLRKDMLIWNAGRGLWYIEDAQHRAWAAEAFMSADSTDIEDDELSRTRPRPAG